MYYIETNSDGTPKNNSVVRKTKQGYSLPLIDITESIKKGFHGSGREAITSRYYIRVTANGEPVSGTVTNIKPDTGNYVDITQSYLQQTKIDPFLLDEAALYTCIIVGNSNATNMSGQAAPPDFVNASINSNKKVEWNLAGDALIISDNILGAQDNNRDRLAQHKFQPTFYGYYNPAVLMANELSRIIKEVTGKTIQFISISGSANGAMIENGNDNTFAELSNNSIHFQYLQQGIQAAKTYATSIGKTLKVPFIVMIDGEVESIRYNAIPESDYRHKTVLHQYRRNLNAMITPITGITYDVPVFRHQFHAQQTTDVLNMDVKQMVYSSSFNEMPVIHPTYHLSILSGFDHWDAEATFKMFGYFTRNLFRFLYQKNGVIFKPNKISLAGNIITIEIDVPTPPLRIDTSRGLELYHGFTVKNSVATDLTITNIEVLEKTIKLTTASSPAGGTLYYKLYRPYAPDLNRFGSYIADSDQVHAYGFVLSNYLLSFKQAV